MPWHVFGDQIHERDAEFPLHCLCIPGLNGESLFPEISPREEGLKSASDERSAATIQGKRFFQRKNLKKENQGNSWILNRLGLPQIITLQVTKPQRI